MSRREFFKLSGVCGAAAVVSSIEGVEVPPPPLTNLPTLFTYNTPLKIDFLGTYADPKEKSDPEWVIMNNIALDILPPVYPIHYSKLGVEPLHGYQYAWGVKLPHITGSPTEITAVVAWGDRFFYRRFNGSLEGKRGDIVSTYAYTEQRRTYSTKIWNDLTVFAALAKWQKEHGPIMPGETFSFIEMSDLRERLHKDYKMGIATMGGGICAAVSTLSKSIFLSSARGYTEILRRYVHRPYYQYWASPLDPGITKRNSDATVYFKLDPMLKYRDVDFTFKVKEDSPAPVYLSFAAHLDYDKESKSGRDRNYDADARFSFSITVRTTPPTIDEEASLLGLRSEYAEFHEFVW